jgi:translation elongation factor EF-Tu-like GTPase
MAVVLICIMVITVFLLAILILIKNKISVGKEEEDFFINKEYNKTDSFNINSSAGFVMEIEDVFSITGRGTVVTGKIKSGIIKKGERVFIKKSDGTVLEDIAVGIESFSKMKDTAEAGQNIGLLLKNIKRDRLQRGDIITK